MYIMSIGVRDGGQGGSCPPPKFGEFADINSGRESTLFGQNSVCPPPMDVGPNAYDNEDYSGDCIVPITYLIVSGELCYLHCFENMVAYM